MSNIINGIETLNVVFDDAPFPSEVFLVEETCDMQNVVEKAVSYSKNHPLTLVYIIITKWDQVELMSDSYYYYLDGEGSKVILDDEEEWECGDAVILLGWEHKVDWLKPVYEDTNDMIMLWYLPEMEPYMLAKFKRQVSKFGILGADDAE